MYFLFLCPQLVVKTKYIDTLIKLLLYFTYFTLLQNELQSDFAGFSTPHQKCLGNTSGCYRYKKNKPTPYFLRNITICNNVAKKVVIYGIEVSIECELRKAFDIIRSICLWYHFQNVMADENALVFLPPDEVGSPGKAIQ